MIELKTEAKEFVKDASSNISDRLKMPLIIVYICVLITYNWDFLYILLFSKQDEILIVNYLKESESVTYPERFFIPLFWSILSTLLFPILQIGLNYLYQGYKNQDIERVYEELALREVKKKEVNDKRTGNQEVADLINKIKTLENDQVAKSKIIEELNEIIFNLQSEKEVFWLNNNEEDLRVEGNIEEERKLELYKTKIIDDLHKFDALLRAEQGHSLSRIIKNIVKMKKYYSVEDISTDVNVSNEYYVNFSDSFIEKFLNFCFSYGLIEKINAENTIVLLKSSILGKEIFNAWLAEVSK